MSLLAFPYAPAPDGKSGTHTALDPRHVADMLRLLILAVTGERVMRPGFGTPVRQLLFSGAPGIAAEALSASLEAAIQTWLGAYLTVEDLEIAEAAAEPRIDIRVVYRLTETGAPGSVDVTLGAA